MSIKFWIHDRQKKSKKFNFGFYWFKKNTLDGKKPNFTSFKTSERAKTWCISWNTNLVNIYKQYLKYFSMLLIFHDLQWTNYVTLKKHISLNFRNFGANLCQDLYESVSKSFRTGHLERELQMVQLSAIRYSCITILWVSLVSFAAITFCVSSRRMFVVVLLFHYRLSPETFVYTHVCHSNSGVPTHARYTSLYDPFNVSVTTRVVSKVRNIGFGGGGVRRTPRESLARHLFHFMVSVNVIL
jgi:hypothetical protein